jgi:hypothetical protein
VFGSLYSGKGLFMSWQTFSTQADSDFAGWLAWVKPTNSAARYYPAGFNYWRGVSGMLYTPPVGTNLLVNLPISQMAFSGGFLATNFSNGIRINAGNKVVNISSNSLSMTFSPNLGTFSGTVTDPATLKSFPFSGAVFQRLNVGYGFLMGTNQSSQAALFPD